MHKRLTGAKRPQITTAGPGAAGPMTKIPRRGPGRVAAAVAAGAATLLAAGCASGGLSVAAPGTAGGDGGGSGAAKPAPGWQALSTQHSAVGTWTVGSTFIVVANSQITAYNQATGKVAWRTKAPVVQGDDTSFCGASQTVSGTTAVVGLGVITDKASAGADCHSIVSVNVTTGKLGWVQALPTTDQQDEYAHALSGVASLAQNGILIAVSKNTVVAGWLGVLAAFSLTSGSRQWTMIEGGGTDFENYVTKDIAISGPSAYVTAGEVYPAKAQLLRVDTATGAVTGKLSLTKANTTLSTPTDATVLSTSPLVVAAEQVTPKFSSSIVMLSDNLAARGVVPGTGLLATPALSTAQDHEFFPFALGDGLLAAVTVPAAGSPGTNQLVAYDSATGVKKWTAAAPAGTEFFTPVAVAGSVIQVAGISGSGHGNPVLTSVDAATGKVLTPGTPRVLGPAPLGEANPYYRYVRADGHVFGVNWATTATSAGSVPAVFTLS